MTQASDPEGGWSVLRRISVLAFLLGWGTQACAVERLQSYAVKLDDTSVSGISSGAYMAVQFAVAQASIISGVGATAGGPFYCAADEVPSLVGSIDNVLARCMQGDPKYPAQEIDARQLKRMLDTTDEWVRSGRIDGTNQLQRQKIWLFHGYNDGVVKSPVTDALYTYYAHYVDPDRIFYKNNLRAGHAQITADCPAGKKICDLCERTGGNFLSRCASDAGGSAPYDAVGSMLQHIYGTLRPKNTGTPTGKIVRFSQREFARDGTGAAVPINIAMADAGYLYVPDTCARREPCRVHVAFHGCLQSAYSIKDAFYRYAGYNGWADTNHLLVLYPQVRPTAVPVLLPLNPQGCWDWWGYNDIFDSAGRYATKDGLQITAVRRMLDRLAGQSRPAPASGSSEGSFGAPADVVVGDFTHRQVELRWNAVQAAGYNVYRSPTTGGPYAQDQRINSKPVTTSTFVDAKLNPGTRYFYVVRAVDESGDESSNSDEVAVVTADDPPACDPYYSLDRNLSVAKDGEPTTQTCN